MGELCVGMDDALKALTVAKALRKVEKERGLSTADAIEHLSSCLTVMKLLGTVESQQAEAHLNYKGSILLSKDQQPEIRGSVHNSLTQNSTHGSKSKLSRQSLSTTASRKRPSMETNDKHSTCNNTCDNTCDNALNVKVAKQAIAGMEQSHHNVDSSLSRSKSSSPRTKRATDPSSKREDDRQPPSSRPRLDSI